MATDTAPVAPATPASPPPAAAAPGDSLLDARSSFEQGLAAILAAEAPPDGPNAAASLSLDELLAAAAPASAEHPTGEPAPAATPEAKDGEPEAAKPAEPAKEPAKPDAETPPTDAEIEALARADKTLWDWHSRQLQSATDRARAQLQRAAVAQQVAGQQPALDADLRSLPADQRRAYLESMPEVAQIVDEVGEGLARVLDVDTSTLTEEIQADPARLRDWLVTGSKHIATLLAQAEEAGRRDERAKARAANPQPAPGGTPGAPLPKEPTTLEEARAFMARGLQALAS